MNKEILLLIWVFGVAGLTLNAGDTGQAQILAGVMHYLSAAGKMTYQPPVIDKEWRVKNETPYTLLINGNPVEPDMVLTSSDKGQTIAVADFVSNGKVHFKPFTVKRLQDDRPDWTHYVAVTIKPGILWGVRVGQHIATYTDEDIKQMVATHPVLKNEPELTEWQVVNRSSYPIKVNDVELTKGKSIDGKLADTDTMQVKVPLTEQSQRITPITIDLKKYKGLLLRQRDQWLKIEIVNAALFKHGINYKISRENHFALFGPHGYLSTGWSFRKGRDVFLMVGILSLIHYKFTRSWRYGNK